MGPWWSVSPGAHGLAGRQTHKALAIQKAHAQWKQFLPGRIRAGLLEEGPSELGHGAWMGVFQMVRK